MENITDWRKSRRSNGDGECVQVANWRKSRRSATNGEFVEAGDCQHGVAVRDSKDPAGPVLAFSGITWARFTEAVKSPR